MAKKGFWPVGTLSGSPWQGSVKWFDHGAAETDIFVGDVVEFAENSSGNVNAAKAGSTNILGVCVGTEAVTKYGPTKTLALAGTSLTLEQTYVNNGEYRRVAVCTAPDAIYRTTTVSAHTRANIGHNADHVNTAGDYATGRSGHILAGTSGTATAGFRILAPVEEPGANIAAANAEWLVVVNESTFKATTGT